MPFPVPLPPHLLALAAELSISPQDIDEQFTRGSGHGGQKVNKTSSAVQLRHRPTNITVKVQQHREQSKNRLSAWKLLIRKIEEKKKGSLSQHAKLTFKLRKQKARRGRRSKEKMLKAKHHRAGIKEGRRGENMQ